MLFFFFLPTERVSNASVTPTDLTVEGKFVNLTCNASGALLTRKWMKDGTDLNLTSNMTLSDDNSVLAFNTLNRQNRGEYSCNISNPVSSDEAKYSMDVYCK